MTSGIGLEEARRVVEVGPGSGAFTGHIVEKLGPDASFLMVELNKDFHSRLCRRYPGIRIVNDSAERLVEILEQEGMGKVDAVISGLPWAVFPEGLQKRIMDQIYESLADGGHFTTYAYFQGCFMPAGQKIRKMLHEKFHQVHRSPLVIRNLPPAYVYRCRKNPQGNASSTAAHASSTR